MLLAYYKGLLVTGLRKTKSYLIGGKLFFTQPVIGIVPPRQPKYGKTYVTFTMLIEDEKAKKYTPVLVWDGCDLDIDGQREFLLDDAEEIDDTYDPLIIDPEDQEDIGTTEIDGKPFPRSEPMPIGVYDFTPLFDRSRFENNDYDKGFRITNAEFKQLMDRGYRSIFTDFKKKSRLMTRAELMDLVVPISFDDGSLFFYDNETVSLIPEEDFIPFYLRAKSDLPHPYRSPSDVEMQIDDVEKMKARSLFKSINLRGRPEAKVLKDLGIPLFTSSRSTQSHPIYGPIHIICQAREMAFKAGNKTIEEEFAKMGKMNVVRVNRLIRNYADEPIEVRSKEIAKLTEQRLVTEKQAKEQAVRNEAEELDIIEFRKNIYNNVAVFLDETEELNCECLYPPF